MSASQRTLCLVWGFATLGLIYSELNPGGHSGIAMNVIGIITGATLMHYVNEGICNGHADTTRRNLAMWGAMALLVRVLLSSLQVAIVPYIMKIGIIVLALMPLADRSNSVMSFALLTSIVLSAVVHPVFRVDAPVGRDGPYPIFFLALVRHCRLAGLPGAIPQTTGGRHGHRRGNVHCCGYFADSSA